MAAGRTVRQFLATAAAALLSCPSAHAADTAPPCSGPEYALLDFWLGDWDVYIDGKKIGRNRIDRILDGCAVQESWSSDGELGMGLFFYQPVQKRWKQVWLSNTPAAPGGIKEKTLLKAEPGRMTHFEGELTLPDGRHILDRTILTSNADASVRQVIENSQDGGMTWKTGFDALYKLRR